ncbi:MAG TPA: RNA polymerase sigma factor SigI [Streptosporangiaceae bacterium]|nr:RNA polymerase sigma factor SigI [Streptosporangiaceae bacterium]
MDNQQVSRVYREHRAYLVDLAFRMLGDIGAAEDVVQDAFTRLMRVDISEIEDVRGWLIVVTSRLSLDVIRSARSRHERAHDASQLEGVAAERSELADPADRVTFDDSVRLALLVVLERLTPAERVVFVLHDVFRMPFDEVAVTVGRTTAACRQLARRARQRVAMEQRFDVQSVEHRQVADKFIAACATGNLDGLLEVLAPDAWGAVDLGPETTTPVVTGADRVARNLLRFWGPPATLVSHPVGGQPALLGFVGRDLAAVLVLTMDGELIQSIQVISDPRKLSFLRSQLSGT